MGSAATGIVCEIGWNGTEVGWEITEITLHGGWE